MKISIIIPAYNAEKFLLKTVQSVIDQTFEDWELVVVNDGSKDDTLKFARNLAARDSRIRVVTQVNSGVAAARNRGIAEISHESEFVIFLDHDDLWRPDTLRVLLDALEKHPEAVGAHGLAIPVDVSSQPEGTFIAHGTPSHRVRRKVIRKWGRVMVVNCTSTEPTTFNVHVYDCPLLTPGQMLARRGAVEQVGGFDSRVSPCDDGDYWARMSLYGPEIIVNEIILNWRIHGANASSSKASMGHGVSQLRRHMMSYADMTAKQRALAHWRYRRVYASVERHNAQDSLRWAFKNLCAGSFRAFVKDFISGLSLYGRYQRLVWFWGNVLDKGPIPERLKDHLREHDDCSGCES